jgi:hypothetical protein
MASSFWPKEASMIPLASISIKKVLTVLVVDMMNRVLIELH